MTGFHVCSQNTSEPENLTAANSYSIELQLLSYHCMRFSQKLMCPVYQQLQRMVCLNILIEKPDFDMTLMFSFQRPPEACTPSPSQREPGGRLH